MYTKDLYLTATKLNSLSSSDWKLVSYDVETTTDNSIRDYKNEVISITQNKYNYPNQVIIHNITGDDLEYLIINNEEEEIAYDSYANRTEIIAGNILGFIFLPQDEYLFLYDVGPIRGLALRAVNSSATNVNPLRIDFTDYYPIIIERT